MIVVGRAEKCIDIAGCLENAMLNLCKTPCRPKRLKRLLLASHQHVITETNRTLATRK